MKTYYLVVQKGDRLCEIWELTLFQKGVTPGDSSKIWEKSRLLRLRLQESVQPYSLSLSLSLPPQETPEVLKTDTQIPDQMVLVPYRNHGRHGVRQCFM